MLHGDGSVSEDSFGYSVLAASSNYKTHLKVSKLQVSVRFSFFKLVQGFSAGKSLAEGWEALLAALEALRALHHVPESAQLGEVGEALL